MTRYLKTAFAAAAALLAASCIRNDIPYPVIELRIANVEGPGFTVSENNAASRVVTLALDEATDIRNVKIDAVTYDAVIHSVELDKAEILKQVRSSRELTGTFNLLSPIYTTLSLYQDYDWTIRATQTIERRFNVTGQIGATEIDAESRTAKVYVPDNTDLKHIEVSELKLGPAGITTYSPTLEELSGSSFESVRFVDVTCHGITERWMLYVETSNVKIALRDPDVWKNTATITALVSAGEYASGAALEYRIKGDTEWQAMQESGYDAGILTATIAPEWDTATNPKELTVYKLVPKKGFFAGHTYEFRLLVGGEETETMEYAAPSGQIIPGGDMEGSPSCFTTNNKETEAWGSGNNTAKSSLCTKATFEGMQGSQCAKLTASVTLKILASGNLFFGTFNFQGFTGPGTVGFGQKYNYTARPSALKVLYHATVGTVDQNRYNGPLAVGEQDISQIFVCIVDWSARREVTSGLITPSGMWSPAEQRNLEGSGNIIAYGILPIDKTTAGNSLVPAEIPLLYYDKEAAAPTGKYTLVISCSTSAYGDYMNGCTENVLYVDDFEWVY